MCVCSYWGRPSYGRSVRVVGRVTLSTAPWSGSPGGPRRPADGTGPPFAGCPAHRRRSTASRMGTFVMSIVKHNMKTGELAFVQSGLVPALLYHQVCTFPHFPPAKYGRQSVALQPLFVSGLLPSQAPSPRLLTAPVDKSCLQ